MSKTFLTPLGLLARATNPASGSTGDTYYNTGDNKVYTYNGSSWVMTGVQGTQGPQGTTGTGTQGTQGFQGTTGTGTQGTQGFQGTQGIQSPQGVQGPQGISGASGGGSYSYTATAPTSPTVGDRWVDSDTGIIYTYVVDSGGGTGQWAELAASGFSGAQGPTGSQGLQGTDGAQGVQGTQGLQGTFGPYNTPLQGASSGTSYTLTVTDAGKTVNMTSTGGVTVPASIFSAGDNLVVFNNTTASQTVTQGASVTLRLAGTASTGNRTLSQYGVATLLCITGGSTPVFVIAGTGLS